MGEIDKQIDGFSQLIRLPSTDNQKREAAIHDLGGIAVSYGKRALKITPILIDIAQQEDADIEHRKIAIYRLGQIGEKHSRYFDDIFPVLSDLFFDNELPDGIRHETLNTLYLIGRESGHKVPLINLFLNIIKDSSLKLDFKEKALGELYSMILDDKDNLEKIIPAFSEVMMDSNIDKKLRMAAFDDLSYIARNYKKQAEDITAILINVLNNEEYYEDTIKIIMAIRDAVANIPDNKNEGTITSKVFNFIGLEKDKLEKTSEYISLFISKLEDLSQNHSDPRIREYADLSAKAFEAENQREGESVSLSYNHNDSAIINMFLDKMNLSLPQKSKMVITDIEEDDAQYMHGTGCRLLFLTRYGLTIKILTESDTQNYLVAKDSDLALKPLKYVMLGKSSFMILPAIELVKSSDNIDRFHWGFIREEIKDSNFEANNDQQAANIGFLPVPWLIDGKDTKLPVILDHGCIEPKRNLSEKGALKAEFTEKAAYVGIQEKLFGHIKEKLLEAWPEGELPNSNKMAEFFEYCAEIVNKPKDDPARVLVPGWNETDGVFAGKSDRACRIAKNYDAALGDMKQ